MDREVVELYLDDIIPNRFQPREVFNEEALRELSASIKEHGVIQPIIVRKIGDKYEIIAGERRYKASTMAGLTKIPAIIRNMDDKEASKVALLENLQRKDLTAIEEARTYQKILELDSMTQEELGRTMGKSQAAIANKMRLLSLPDEVQEALLQDKISERHARSLLNLDTPEEQINMLRKIVERRMTVRELDNEIRITKGDSMSSSTINNDNTVIVNEPKPEFYQNDDLFHQTNPTINSILEENQNKHSVNINNNAQDLEFKIPLPTPNPIELLDDYGEDKIPELPKENNSILSKEPETDFMKIEELLRTTKNTTLQDAVNEIKGVVAKLQNRGFDINTEELDYENTYQVVIKIEKNK